MRILHIITSLRTGGAERLVVDLLPRIRRRGHQVELLLFDGTGTPLLETLRQQGIVVRALGRGYQQMWNPLHAIRLKRFLNREKYDIVHTHNTPCQLLSALAAGKNAPALVTTEHNTFNRRRKWRFYGTVDRLMYGKYDHVACVSEKTRRNLEARLRPGRAIPELSVVPNGIDLDRFGYPGHEASLRCRGDHDKKIIIMIAAFRPQKDQQTLIRAMRHLPEEYGLWLVGEGPMRASCERLAEELDLGGRVRFLGVRSDVPELLAASDVVVLSSHYEGMALSSIEGMASGKPFIASDVEGLQETVDGAGLLFPCGDDRRLAAMIGQVCGDPVLYGRMGERGRARARHYDIETTAESYVDIYELICKKYQ